MHMHCGNSSVGRAQPCQGWGREFESRFPLQKNTEAPTLSGLSVSARRTICTSGRSRLGGRVVMQRPAKPWTPVRFRPQPPITWCRRPTTFLQNRYLASWDRWRSAPACASAHREIQQARPGRSPPVWASFTPRGGLLVGDGVGKSGRPESSQDANYLRQQTASRLR